MPKLLQDVWYGRSPLGILLIPFGWIYRFIALLRRQAYLTGMLSVNRFPVPVIVVGNLSVGGTGKTPLVIWLSNFLKENNYKPGIVSRGYRGAAEKWPQQVRPDSDPVMVGDEAVVLARRTACPVSVAPDRSSATAALIGHAGVDVIICDDGLQHLALGRDLEIVVVDGVRRHGNGRCLPAGPLREPASRLASADLVVTNGIADRGEFSMKYIPRDLRSLTDESRRTALASFQGRKVHAVAGIGNPESFFAMLRRFGYQIIEHEFPDHHAFTKSDISFGDGLPVVMTEKDAVKCRRHSDDNHWYVPIQASMQPAFGHRVMAVLKDFYHGQETA